MAEDTKKSGETETKSPTGPAIDPYHGNARSEIRNMVEQGLISPEDLAELAQELQATRKQTETSVVRVLEETLGAREGQVELLKNLEAQYPAMKATLERYEISTEGMPTWEQVKKNLTPEVLDKALKLTKPSLLLIPPSTRQSKVEAIDKHPARGQKYDTYTYALKSDDLWNDGKSASKNWRVSIVDGVQDVAQDKEIYDGARTIYEISKLWVKKLEDQGLDVMNDVDAYLTLMMKGLAKGKPVDPNTYTVLNGKNLTKSSGVAVGLWGSDRVRLGYGDPGVFYDLRLRGSVGVDVPESA